MIGGKGGKRMRGNGLQGARDSSGGFALVRVYARA